MARFPSLAGRGPEWVAELVAEDARKLLHRALSLEWAAGHVSGAEGVFEGAYDAGRDAMRLALAIRDGGTFPLPRRGDVGPAPAPGGAVEAPAAGEWDVLDATGPRFRVRGGDARRVRLFALAELGDPRVTVVPALAGLAPRVDAASAREVEGGLVVADLGRPPTDEAPPVPAGPPADGETPAERVERINAVFRAMAKGWPPAPPEASPAPEAEALPDDAGTGWLDWAAYLDLEDDPVLIFKAPALSARLLAGVLLGCDQEGFDVERYTEDDELALGLVERWGGFRPVHSATGFEGVMGTTMAAVDVAFDGSDEAMTAVARRLGIEDGGEVAEPTAEVVAPAADPVAESAPVDDRPAEAPPRAVPVPTATNGFDASAEASPVGGRGTAKVIDVGNLPKPPRQDNYDVFNRDHDLHTDEHVARLYGIVGGAKAAKLKAYERLAIPAGKLGELVVRKASRDLAGQADDWGGDRVIRFADGADRIAAPAHLLNRGDSTPDGPGPDSPSGTHRADDVETVPHDEAAPATPEPPDGTLPAEGLQTVPAPGEQTTLLAEGDPQPVAGPAAVAPEESWWEASKALRQEWDLTEEMVVTSSRRPGRYRIQSVRQLPDGATLYAEGLESGGTVWLESFQRRGDRYIAPIGKNQVEELTVDGPASAMPIKKPLYLWTDEEWARDEAERSARTGRPPVIAPMEEPTAEVDPGIGRFIVKAHKTGVPLYWIEAADAPAAIERAKVASTHSAAWNFGAVRAILPGEWATLPTWLTETDWESRVPTEAKPARGVGKPTASRGPDDKHGAGNGTGWKPGELGLFPGGESAPASGKAKGKADPVHPRWTGSAPKLGLAARAEGPDIDVRAWARKVWPDTPIRMEGFDAKTWDSLPELTPAGLVGGPAGLAPAEVVAPPEPEVISPAPAPAEPVPVPAGTTTVVDLWDVAIFNMGRCDRIATLAAADAREALDGVAREYFGINVDPPKFVFARRAASCSAALIRPRDEVASLATGSTTHMKAMPWDLLTRADGGEPQLLGRVEADDPMAAVRLAELRHPEYEGEIYQTAALSTRDFRFARKPLGRVAARDGVQCWGSWLFEPTAPETIPAEEAGAAPHPVAHADGTPATDTDAQLLAVVRASVRGKEMADRLAEEGAYDSEVKGMLARAFEGRALIGRSAKGERPIYGSVMDLPGGVSCCYTAGEGGDAPQLWAGKREATGKATLYGGELILRARQVLSIPLSDGSAPPERRRPGRPSATPTPTAG